MLAARRFTHILRQTRIAVPLVSKTAFHALTKPTFAIRSSAMQLRFAATEAKSSITEELAKEIEFEEGNAEVDTEYEDAKKLTLQHFKLHEKPGNGVVRLTRKYNDEQIEVKFDVQDSTEEELGQDEDYGQTNEGEEDEAIGDNVGVNFEVTIKKGANKLIVSAVGGENLSIEGIRIMSANASETEESEVYSGPPFDELQEEVQETFLDWLEERKIDGDLAFFVLAHARTKEQQEYVHWLHELQDFTDKGSK